MPQSTPASRAAVAFTVKSGWAAAVLVAGPPASPRVVDSRTVELSDPALPESRRGVRHRTTVGPDTLAAGRLGRGVRTPVRR